MAATNPLPNLSIVNVQMFGRCCAQRIINLFQYQNLQPSDPNDEYTVPLNKLYSALTVANNLFDRFLDVMPPNYLLDFVRIQPVFPTRMRFIDSIRGDNGTNGTITQTANVAASIERFGIVGGRRAIGRVQLVTSPELCANGSISDAGYAAALADLAAQMVVKPVTTTPSITWQPIIHSTANPQPLTIDVAGATVMNTVRTMHRRTVGLGI